MCQFFAGTISKKYLNYCTCNRLYWLYVLQSQFLYYNNHFSGMKLENTYYLAQMIIDWLSLSLIQERFVPIWWLHIVQTFFRQNFYLEPRIEKLYLVQETEIYFLQVQSLMNFFQELIKYATNMNPIIGLWKFVKIFFKLNLSLTIMESIVQKDQTLGGSRKLKILT